MSNKELDVIQSSRFPVLTETIYMLVQEMNRNLINLQQPVDDF